MSVVRVVLFDSFPTFIHHFVLWIAYNCSSRSWHSAHYGGW